MDKERRSVRLYDLALRHNVPHARESEFKSRLLNIIPYYVYHYQDDTDYMDYIEEKWNEELSEFGRLHRGLGYRYIKDNRYHYIVLFAARSVQNINKKSSLYPIFMDAAFIRWLILNEDPRRALDFDVYNEWIGFNSIIDRNRLQRHFNDIRNDLLYNIENYHLVRGILLEKSDLNYRLYTESKSELLRLINQDGLSPSQIDGLISEYKDSIEMKENIIIENTTLKARVNQIQQEKNSQQVAIYSSIMHTLDGSDSNYALSRLIFSTRTSDLATEFLKQNTMNMVYSLADLGIIYKQMGKLIYSKSLVGREYLVDDAFVEEGDLIKPISYAWYYNDICIKPANYVRSEK